MRVLVFGRTGQVAQELVRLMPEATFLGREEADLTRPAACAGAILMIAPDIVINAAAWTAVDRAEAEEDAALAVNATAPGAMAEACARIGASLVQISTDYVFDGSGNQPWRVTDATAPLNAYGCTKLAGEQAVQASDCSHAILRTSWVFSAHGANFVKTMLRLAQSRDRLSVVADQIGGPTPAAGIAAACLSLGIALRDGAEGGVLHYAGAPETSWAGFARETFKQAGLAVTVEDIATSAYPTPAARPLNSRLDCSEIENIYGIPRPDWRAALAEVIADLKEGSA